MKPKRAMEIFDNAAITMPHGTNNLEQRIRDAILIACAEERKAALTEAAEACHKVSWARGQHMSEIRDRFAATIERLRDGP